jgi:hypothetical protein
MAKAFYTEKDIEALAQGGTKTLEVTDAVVLTELAYEKARQLGLKLVGAGGAERPDTPPSAPGRPYISKGPGEPPPAPGLTHVGAVREPPLPDQSPAPAAGDLAAHIRKAVIARLGDQVEASMLDAIIARVLNATGMK